MLLFGHRLAAHLGEWDALGMMRTMSISQFRYWREFEKLEPFGYWPMEGRTARILSMIFNRFRGSKETQRDPSVFLPRNRAAPKQSVNAMAAILRSAIAAAQGARKKGD